MSKFKRETIYTMAQEQARSKIVESPASSNIVKYNDWYYDPEAVGCDFKNYFGAANMYIASKKKNWAPQFAWCGTFVAYCYHFAGYPLPKELHYRMYYVPTAQNWMAKKGMRREFKDAQLMDIITFDWDHNKAEDHVGLVISFDGEYFKTIEGNTSPDRRGNQSNGGEVCMKKRHKSVVEGVYNVLD